MHLQCLAVAGLLASVAVAEGQRHKRIVTEGYVYKGRAVDSKGTGAPTAYTTAYTTGSPALPSDYASFEESSLTHFQYAPTTASESETSTNGSALTASATLRTTSGISFGGNSTHSAPSGYFPPSGATGSGYGPNKTSSASLCTGQTLNVLSASLDWWYAETYTYVASIFSITTNGTATTWSVVTPSTTFDITSALASPSCDSSLIYNPTFSTSLYNSSCSPTPGPVAASTIVITQTAYKSFIATTGTGGLPDVATQPTPAAVTVPSQTSGYSAGVPFVFFSAYEIMSKSQRTYGNGSVGCAESTQRVDMPEPFSFEFTGGDVNGSLEVGAHVTGDVNPAFLGIYSINAVAGSWVAAPTVVVIVDQVLAAQSVLTGDTAGSTQVTATSLILPSPTLPSFTVPDGPATQSTESGWEVPSPVVQSSATGGLIVPTASSTTTSNGQLLSTVTFIANQETTEITLAIPVPSTQSIITTTLGGHVITATALSDVNQQTDGPGAQHTTQKESTVTTNTSPTNALDVLTAALSSGNLGSAILAGLGVSSFTALPEVFTSAPNVTPALMITVGSTVYSGNAGSTFTIGSSVLTPGGSVVVTDGNVKETISLGSNGEVVTIVDGVTVTSAFEAATSAPNVTPAPLITIDSTVYRGNAGSTFTIDGSVLTPGGSIVLTNGDSTETIALGSANGGVITVSDGTTITSALGAGTTDAPILTIHGKGFTAIDGSTFMMNGQTLTPGGVETVTVSGHTYIVSLSPQGTVVEVLTMGSDGHVTASTYETLYAAAQGGTASVYTTVDASASQGASATGPDASATASPTYLYNSAQSMSLPYSGVALGLASLLLAVWL